MKDLDQRRRSRSHRDRLPKPGEIATWSKTYWTSFERRPEGMSVFSEGTSQSDVPKSLRRRSTENLPPLLGEFGTYAVDATAKELHEWLALPDNQFSDEVFLLRRQIWWALDKANETVKPLKASALEKQRFREALPHLDDLMAILNRSSHVLGTLPSASHRIGANQKVWRDVLLSLENLPTLRETVANAARGQRGSKGTPFEDAFILGLAEIWQQRTKNSSAAGRKGGQDATKHRLPVLSICRESVFGHPAAGPRPEEAHQACCEVRGS